MSDITIKGTFDGRQIDGTFSYQPSVNDGPAVVCPVCGTEDVVIAFPSPMAVVIRHCGREFPVEFVGADLA